MSISAAIPEGRLSARDVFFSGIYAESSGNSGHVIEINAKVTEGSIPQTKSWSGFKVHGGPRQFQLEPIAHGIVATQQDCWAISEQRRPWVLKHCSTRTQGKMIPSAIMGVSSLCSLPKSLEPVVHRTQVLLNYSVFASQRRVPGILAHGGGSCSDGRECAGGEARLSCAL